MTMLDAVYIDAKNTKSIVAIKPKPPFMPVFQVAATKSGSKIRTINEPLQTPAGSSSVFLVETGEISSISARQCIRALLDSYFKCKLTELALVK